jgi:hypothetical protein
MLLHAVLLFHPLWFPLLASIMNAFLFKWLFELLSGKYVKTTKDEQVLWWFSVFCGFWSVFAFIFLEVLASYTLVDSYLEYLTRFVNILALAYVFNVYIMVPLTIIGVAATVFLPLLGVMTVAQRRYRVLELPVKGRAMYIASASMIAFFAYLIVFFFLNLTAKQASDRNWDTFHRFNAHIKNLCAQQSCPENEEQLAAFDRTSFEFLKLRTKVYYVYNQVTEDYHWYVQYTPKLVLESHKNTNFEVHYLGSEGTVAEHWSVAQLRPFSEIKGAPHRLFVNGTQFHDFWVQVLNLFKRPD